MNMAIGNKGLSAHEDFALNTSLADQIDLVIKKMDFIDNIATYSNVTKKLTKWATENKDNFAFVLICENNPIADKDIVQGYLDFRKISGDVPQLLAEIRAIKNQRNPFN